MKQVVQVLILLTALPFTFAACTRCVPPPCVRTKQVIEWTRFFKDNKSIRFTNGMQVDTLDVNYAEIINFCGIEECLTELDFIQIEAISRKNNFSFLLKDGANDYLYLAKVSGVTDIHDAVTLKPTIKIVSYEAIRGDYRLTDLTINGQATDAIVMNFAASEDIQSITLAKNFGIIAYTDKEGNIWKKE